mgnify:CR=1 FL=1
MPRNISSFFPFLFHIFATLKTMGRDTSGDDFIYSLVSEHLIWCLGGVGGLDMFKI